MLDRNKKEFEFLCCFARSNNSFNIDPKTSSNFPSSNFPFLSWSRYPLSWLVRGGELAERGDFQFGPGMLPWQVSCASCTQGGLNTPMARPAGRSGGAHVSIVTQCSIVTLTRHASLIERRIIKSMVAPAPIISHRQMSHNHTC